MDHRVAEERNAVERYLLNEFTAEERSDFEEHLFDCTICGEQVRESAAAIDNLKEVLREEQQQSSSEAGQRRGLERNWKAWFRLPVLVPSLAAFMLGAIVLYQNSVFIPKLQRPQVLSSDVIAPQARESERAILVSSWEPRFNLNFLVDAPEAYPAYICDFLTESGGKIIQVTSGPEKVAAFTLGIALPTKDFPPGRYVMVLRPVTAPQTEVQRYNFVIQEGANR
jgi:hypothetical protein